MATDTDTAKDDYDYEIYNVQLKKLMDSRLTAQSTTRDQKLKRNNDKKIKKTDEHNKSEKQSNKRFVIFLKKKIKMVEKW